MRLLQCSMVLALTILVLGTIVYCQKSKRSIVYFDKEAIQAQFIRQLAETKATDEKVTKVSEQFNASLNFLLSHYAKRHQVTILNRQMVLAGGQDITAEVAKDISASMRKNP
jgi:type-F conjugative transfer system protein TrbI